MGGQVKVVRFLFVDDKEAMHEIMDSLVEDYASSHHDIQIIKDAFYSFEDFEARKAKRYDLAIVDWNIGNSIQERGDNVLMNLNGSCRAKYILTGMGQDLVREGGITEFCVQHSVGLMYKGDFYKLQRDVFEKFDRCFLGKRELALA